MKRGGSSGYDRHITIFSPDGRLFQVEYASRATQNQDSTCIITKNKDTISAVIFKRRKNSNSITPGLKVFPLNNFVGSIHSGFFGDIQMKLNEITEESIKYFQKYKQTIPIDYLAKKISDSNQIFTQYAYMRPLAVRTIILGIDKENGPQIYKCEPSGFCSSHEICGLGESENFLGSWVIKKAAKQLQSSYSFFNATIIAIWILQKIFNCIISQGEIEVMIFSKKKNPYYKLNKKEKELILKNL